MRNRAKCKLCNSVIESFHSEDYVSCKCGEIGVYSGSGLRCTANDWANFMRVDDEGNEIIVTIKDKEELPKQIESRPNRKELMDMLEAFVKCIRELPENAMTAPITHYDLSSALTLLLAILRAEA